MSPVERKKTYSTGDWLLGGLALLLIAGTAALYYLTAGGETDLGAIWPKLLFVPILLAGWRFGLIGGAVSALVGSAALAPQLIYYVGELDTAGWADLSELLALNLVGWCFGLMAEYHRRRSSEADRLTRDLGSANAELAELVGLRDRVSRIEKLESVSRLAGGVAHELRNPLAAIKATVQVTPQEGLSPEAREAFRVICEEVARADAAVKRLLGRSRRSPESTKVKLGELITEVVALVRPRLGDLSLVVDATPGDCCVTGDADALRQVLVNLLVNASEAAAGRVDVTLAVREDEALIRIGDDGPGVTEKDQKRLFEPFFTTKPNGTGLGLFLARQAVQTLGGRIRYVPQDSGGAVFEISLPLVKSSDI
jgi:signal transduction histidine kinase